MHPDPTDASVRALLDRALTGPIVMLNLLRLHDIADYSTHPELEPLEPIPGGAAHHKYIEHTEPLLDLHWRQHPAAESGLQLLHRATSGTLGCRDARPADVAARLLLLPQQ